MRTQTLRGPHGYSDWSLTYESFAVPYYCKPTCFLFMDINIRILPMESQFAAINFGISLAYLISYNGIIELSRQLIFAKISTTSRI